MYRTFQIGTRDAGHEFEVRPGGWVALKPDLQGRLRVIRGTSSLDDNGDEPTWSPIQDATGNNTKISDGQTLYTGAGFDEDLIAGQVSDVLWALGNRAPSGGGMRLLEVGCGPGFLLERLAEELAGWEVAGVDPSPASVEQARSRGLTIYQGTAEDVPPQEKFDAIVVMGNFQLHADPSGSMRAFARLAKPGAKLFLDSKNPNTTVRLASRLALQTPLSRAGIVQGVAAHAYHGMRHGVPQRVLELLLAGAGWEVTKRRTVGPRLLRFGNTHPHAQGVRARLWSLSDRMDSIRGERAWIQITAVRSPMT